MKLILESNDSKPIAENSKINIIDGVLLSDKIWQQINENVDLNPWDGELIAKPVDFWKKRLDSEAVEKLCDLINIIAKKRLTLWISMTDEDTDDILRELDKNELVSKHIKHLNFIRPFSFDALKSFKLLKDTDHKVTIKCKSADEALLAAKAKASYVFMPISITEETNKCDFTILNKTRALFDCCKLPTKIVTFIPTHTLSLEEVAHSGVDAAIIVPDFLEKYIECPLTDIRS